MLCLMQANNGLENPNRDHGGMESVRLETSAQRQVAHPDVDTRSIELAVFEYVFKNLPLQILDQLLDVLETVFRTSTAISQSYTP
jgi:hypothetical protein